MTVNENLHVLATFTALYWLSGLLFWSVLGRALPVAIARAQGGQTWSKACLKLFGSLWLWSLLLIGMMAATATLWLVPYGTLIPSRWALGGAFALAVLASLLASATVSAMLFAIGQGEDRTNLPREAARGLGIPWAMFGGVATLSTLLEFAST